MDKKNSQIDEAITNGYYLELGTAIEKAFENYKKIALLSGLAYILIALAVAGIGFTLAVTLLGMNNITETLTDYNRLDFSGVELALYVIIMVLISGLTSPINAGFLKIAHQAENNKEFSIGTIFDYYKTIHFKELFIAASLLALINLGITFLFEYLGYTIAGNLFTYIIAFFTFLYSPLIVFGNQNGIDALLKSFQLVIKQPFIILLLIIISFIGVFIGLIGLCIGIFFTIPFWNSMLYTIYNTAIPTKESTEIEEIGNIQE